MRRLLSASAAVALALAFAGPAKADLISIGLQEAGTNGGALTVVGTPSSGAESEGPTPYGTFTVQQVSAQSQSALGSPGLLNSQTLDISSTTAGTLHVFVTATGLTDAAGLYAFLSTFAVNALNGTITSVDETTFLSLADVAFATTNTLDTAHFTAISTAVPEIELRNLTGAPFAVTEEYTIVDSGGGTGNTNLTIDLSATAVPEPGTLGLLGASLAAFGLIGWTLRRRSGMIAAA
jgi:hypothetical protein